MVYETVAIENETPLRKCRFERPARRVKGKPRAKKEKTFLWYRWGEREHSPDIVAAHTKKTKAALVSGKEPPPPLPDLGEGWLEGLENLTPCTYHGEAAREAAALGGEINIGEGEKTADALHQHTGRVSVASHGGGNSAIPNDLIDCVRGASLVRVYVDNDETGARFGEQLRLALRGHVGKVVVLRSPLEEKGSDAADHFAAGLGDEDFVVVPDIDGAEILDKVRKALETFIIFSSQHHEVAVTLWIAATHIQPALYFAPRLTVCGPESQCGKSRVLHVARELAHAPYITENVSPAALFRRLDRNQGDPETVLLDEIDALFSNGKSEKAEEIRSLINAGFDRNSGGVTRCEPCPGGGYEDRTFNVFGMLAVCGIDMPPETIVNRSVVVPMRRRAPDEEVTPFQVQTDRIWLGEIRDDLALWLRPRIGVLANTVPNSPLADRPADVWQSLLIVADEAGGDWPKLARAAAVAMNAAQKRVLQENNIGYLLLAACREAFEEVGGISGEPMNFLETERLLDLLNAPEDAPWQRWDRGDGLSGRRLSKLLSGYGIRPVRNTTGTKRGYNRASFEDAWRRYLMSDDEMNQGTCSPPEASCPSEASASHTPADVSVDEPCTKWLRRKTAQTPEPAAGGNAHATATP
ncbi:DUF3631 domain-containing protein [Streptomyces sp. NPDC050804]|uniref:DUF3631 domain-containing protein n=1 Tax=Streptomyces sp. NPDC050804 TaxID=3154745 RepID=UPI003431205D